jgi:hypothetical protein
LGLVLTIQVVLVSLAALISIFFGVRYFTTKEFMPYHAVVTGKAWSQLEPGVRTSILGMLRIIAGGFTTYGLALLWLLIPLTARHWWAPWAVLTLTCAGVLPSLYVTIALRRAAPAAKTPVAAAAVVLTLGLLGAAVSFWD